MKKLAAVALASLLILGAVGCGGGSDLADSNNPLQDAQIKLQSFSYADVTLMDGEVKSKIDEIFDYYLALNVDDMMYDLRKQRNMDTKGGRSLCTDSNNWWSNGTLMMGFWLWGYSRIYNYTGDETVKEKANYLADSLYEAYKVSPFISNNSYYPIEKFIQGLLDNYVYCGNETALEFATVLVTYANGYFVRQDVLGDNGTEWYILSESIYKYIECTRDLTMKGLAEDFEYIRWWDIFDKGENVLDYTPEAGNFPTHFHAFSHINSLSGAAMAYKEKGEEYYYGVLEKAWDWLRDTQMMATGGVGASHEHLLSQDEIIDALNSRDGDSCETQCNAYAIGKLADYMTQFTGKSEYGDWEERAIWNLLVSLPTIEDGYVMYYGDYETTGGEKRNRDIQWTCCCGSCLVNATNAISSVYYHDTQNIYVNQFVPSTVLFERTNSQIKLTQTTQFPYENRVRLAVETTSQTPFSVKIRRPEWANGIVAVTVNGEQVDVKQDVCGWIVIERTWANGDEVEITFPMQVTTSGFNSVEYDGGVYALSYGPIVLVGEVSVYGKTPANYLDYETAAQSLQRVSSENLEFSVAGTDKVTFSPYYSMPTGQTYYMYMQK